MTVSLMCVSDRPERLPCLVWSLIAQTYREWELLILDQSEAGEVDRFVASDDQRIRVLRVPRHGDWGQTAKEQAAKEHARGDAFMFPNDDAYYLPTALQEMAAALAAGADLVLCGWLYDLFGYRPMPPNPAIGHVDVGGFMVSRARFLSTGWPAKTQTGDGEMIQRWVADGAKVHGCQSVLYCKN